MVFLPNLSVNRRSRLCDVASYVSAQELDFLDLVEDPACGEQKSSSVNWKHQKVPMPILPIYEWTLDSLNNMRLFILQPSLVIFSWVSVLKFCRNRAITSLGKLRSNYS